MRLTYQPEVVSDVRVFINSRYHKVINSEAYQQDRYQQRALINMVGKVGQDMRCCKCNSNSDVLVCETHKHTLSESGLSL